MPVYATSDASEGCIRIGATIYEFESIEDAHAYLKRGYSDHEWDLNTAVIEPGRYSDCWLKLVNVSTGTMDRLRPFEPGDLIIENPGSHPGGSFFWITPAMDVLVLSEIQPRGE